MVHGAVVLQDAVAVEVFSPVREDFLPAAEEADVREARRDDVPVLVAMMDEFYAEAGFTSSTVPRLAPRSRPCWRTLALAVCSSSKTEARPSGTSS